LLLTGYRDALRFIDELPLLGRVPTARSQGRDRHVWASRLLTRIYVQTHIRKQLIAIIRRLEVEELTVETDEATKRASDIASRLRGYVDRLFAWGRLKDLVTRLPIVSAAFPVVVGAITGVALGLESAESLANIRPAVSILLLLLLITYLYIVVPSLSLGFRVKRAIFAGGEEPEDPFTLHRPAVVWKGFPGTNLYQKEDELFAALGARKRREVPLDLLLHYLPYFLTGYVAFTGVSIVFRIADGQVSIWQLGVFVFFTVGLVFILRAGTATFARRRDRGLY
jgi:hypothetical protein